MKDLTETAIQQANWYPVCPIQILLLDFQMPKKNGLQVVVELKEFYKKREEQYR